MNNRLFFLALLYIPAVASAQLTVQQGAGVFLSKNSELTIQGDIESRDHLEGEGTVVLNGNTVQTVIFNKNSVPRLSIENRSNITLASDLSVEKSLILQKGHLQCGQFTVSLGKEAHAEGSANAYIQTGSGGRVMKSLQKDVSDFLLPIGTGNDYAPLLLKSTGSYFNASVEVYASSKPSTNKPHNSQDFLAQHWIVLRKGITGDLLATAWYGKVNGEEQDLSPYYWNGREWMNNNGTIDWKNNLVSLEVPEGKGEMYAMSNGKEYTGNKALTLLPNPVNDVAILLIHSKSDEDAVLSINDSKGNTAIQQKTVLRKGANQVKINVMPLAAGHYTITTSSPTHRRSVKMIKQ